MELLDSILLAKFFGIKVIDTEDFIELVCRFAFNLLITGIIVRYIYYPIAKRKDYLFTYLLFSIIVFFLCHLLSNVKIGLGFALGLFAIFGIIRYRTNPIEIKEMTYLFIIIGISVINALANKKVSYAELVFTNLMVLAITFFLEKIWLLRHETRKRITYEKIELIKPENHKLLMQDLRERTGLNIHRIQIKRINFLRDTARIWIFYYADSGSSDIYEDDSDFTSFNKDTDE